MHGWRRRVRPIRHLFESPDWMRLPLTGYPDFATWQPFLDEIITHPGDDAFRARHDFRRTIDIPVYHVSSLFDIFQTSVISAFTISRRALARRNYGSPPTSTTSSMPAIFG